MKNRILSILKTLVVIVTLLTIAGAWPALAQEGYQACDEDGSCYPAVCDDEEETCQIEADGESFVFWLWCEDEECYACDDEDYCLSLQPEVAGQETAEEAGETETGDEPVPTGSGEVAADLGFRPAGDGFSFPNYGNEVGPINLTPVEMQRMFGDAVCANTAGGDCTLTPPAKAWMDEQNQSMDGGHCEGLAVLSLLFYTDQETESEFGSSNTFSLDIYGNEPLQRELAYWWATQMPTYPLITHGTPAELLDLLIESFKAGGSGETYTIGIYKRDFTGGHAILPYGIEDLGDGRYKVLIYDNNYPGEERVMLIDREANTWQYEASINPSVEPDLYEGDASTDTLELTPTSVRLGNLYCYFCEEAGAEAKLRQGLAQPLPARFVEVYVQGPVKLLISDEQGNQLGWKDKDTFVTEIPGADYVSSKISYEADWEDMSEFIYRIPVGVNFSILADGAWLRQGTSSALNLIGPGFNLWIDDLYLDPGQQDHMYFTSDQGKKWYELTYSPDSSESPEIGIGLETDEADWEFYVQGADLLPGDEFTVGLDYSDGSFYINTTDAEKWSEYEFHVVQFDEEGEYLYGLDSVEMEPNENLYFTFVDPENDTGEYIIEFQDDQSGDMLDTLTLEDKTDQFDEWYYEEPEPTGALYTHPSGAFMAGIPAGWATQAADSGVVFTKDNSQIQTFHTPAEQALSPDNLGQAGLEVIEGVLGDAVARLEVDPESIEVDEESYYFEFTAGRQQGAVLMGQDPEALDVYGLVLLTDDIDHVALDWQRVWSTFTVEPDTAAGVLYIHPTYAFQMAGPVGWVYEERPGGAVFATEENLIVPFYGTSEQIIEAGNLAAQTQALVDPALSAFGTNIVIDQAAASTSGTGFSAPFTFTPTGKKSEGQGQIVIQQEPETKTVYGLIMATAAPGDDVTAIWQNVRDSFQPLDSPDTVDE